MNNQASTIETIAKIKEILSSINLPQDIISRVSSGDGAFGTSLCHTSNLPHLLGLLEELQTSGLLKIQYVQPILVTRATSTSEYYWIPLTNAIRKIRTSDLELLTPSVIFALISCIEESSAYKMDEIVKATTLQHASRPVADSFPATVPDEKEKLDPAKILRLYRQLERARTMPISTQPSLSKAYTFLNRQNPQIAAQIGAARFETKETAIDDVLVEILSLLDKKASLEEVLISNLLRLPTLSAFQFFLKIATLHTKLTSNNLGFLVAYLGEDTEKRQTYLCNISDELQLSSFSLSSESFSNVLRNLERLNGATYYTHLMKILKKLRESSLFTEDVISSLLIWGVDKDIDAISALVDVELLLSQENLEKVLLGNTYHKDTDETFSSMFRHVIFYLSIDGETFKERASLLLKSVGKEDIATVYSVVSFFRKYNFRTINDKWEILCKNKKICRFLYRTLSFLGEELDRSVRDHLPAPQYSCARIMNNLSYVEQLYQLLRLGLPYFDRSIIPVDLHLFTLEPATYMDKLFENIEHIETLVQAKSAFYRAEAIRDQNKTEYDRNEITFIRVLTLLKNPSSLPHVEHIIQITETILGRNKAELSHHLFSEIVTSSRLREILIKYKSKERLYLPEVMNRIYSAVKTSTATDEMISSIMVDPAVPPAEPARRRSFGH